MTEGPLRELQEEEVEMLLHLEEEHAQAVAALLNGEDEEMPEEILHHIQDIRDDQAERVRARGYVVATVPAYLDDDFRGHFRMTRHQVQQLQEDLGAAGAYAEDHGGREPISPGKAPLVLLWTLANQDTIRSISDRFDLTKSSVIRSNRRLTNAIVNDLLGEHVKWPNNTAAGAIDCAGGIEIVGAIDGSHIPISQPVEDQEVYVNRKGFHSLVLQAVCQADTRFIDVLTGYPGSVHDARVFRNSPLCQALPRLCPDGESVILGDSTAFDWVDNATTVINLHQLTPTSVLFHTTFTLYHQISLNSAKSEYAQRSGGNSSLQFGWKIRHQAQPQHQHKLHIYPSRLVLDLVTGLLDRVWDRDRIWGR
ncbi:putative nuclease HARBI1 [Amphibalanus amphitrite]|uniref:putative nuclease HARBI1 n=1 Tax=Amphibalanus amphitrite TaxID=1232801 RepID=UPI001C9088C2|nr:putative nuclease HARBI1 [Amphibalanus amphitrite]